MASLRRYTRVMVWGMRNIAGIKVTVSGHDNVPKEGPVIIAAKHQSYGGERMAQTSQIVREQGRRILIYPEGHLSRVGTQHRYRKGVYHLYADFDCPVVPVATNLGQRWNQNDFIKHAGPASLEFLEPIMPGLGKDEFMALLERRIETRSRELLDMENLGALDPADIGKTEENEVAREKRLRREAEERGKLS